jgi:hypothetical protein
METASSILSRSEWQARRATHGLRVAALADDFVRRRSRGEKHPVHDFLFTYYSFSPAKLKQWIPPLGMTLEMAEEDWIEMPWLTRLPLIREGNRMTLDAAGITPHLRNLARWIESLCSAIQMRPPRFRCFGLHEWAMVYRQSREHIRHQGYELRLSPEETARVVESQAICCSHYDAFRFFTAEAKPLNVMQPVLETRLEMEQAGCLHANMDLYKWSSKLWPWVGSDLIGECFELACLGRDLDMRASPYDLRHLGYDPVCIESPEGRARYEQEQRDLTDKAADVRERLRMAAAALRNAV